MGSQIYTSSFVYETCCSCGVPFGIDANHHADLLRSKRTFYCPNGHRQHYGENEEERLRRRIAGLEEDVRSARAGEQVAENRARAYRGHVTRVKRRVARGQCPACSRSFPDLAAHMREAHPGYDDEAQHEALHQQEPTP